MLFVASAADPNSLLRSNATPVQDSVLRQKVLDWLIEFEQDSSRHAILDWDWHICGEYLNPKSMKRDKLTEQDYGWLALMAKKDRNEVVWVGLDMDADGHAILPATLAPDVTDLADRKIVAAVLAGQAAGNECQLTNACDTDWLDCADALTVHGVVVEHLIEDWLRIKWASMRGQE